MNRIQHTVFATALWACLPSAWAHGGEDHDHDQPPASPTAQASSTWAAQASTATESFEMVVALSKDEAQPMLTLYIDRFSTNEPLQGATVEVESEQFKGVAKALAPGVYQVAGQAFSKPGPHPLTVSVQSGNEADLLDVTLNTAQAETSDHEHAQPRPLRTGLWVLAGIATLGLTGFFIRRRMTAHTSQDLA